MACGETLPARQLITHERTHVLNLAILVLSKYLADLKSLEQQQQQQQLFVACRARSAFLGLLRFWRQHILLHAAHRATWRRVPGPSPVILAEIQLQR